jgi:hypothetical protein
VKVTRLDGAVGRANQASEKTLPGTVIGGGFWNTAKLPDICELLTHVSE